MGTIFLDEIAPIPLNIQAKLLRLLEKRQFERLGSLKSIPVNVRLIASTKYDLGERVAAKMFRGELYNELNVSPIRMPPLRERREDVVALAEHLLAFFGRAHHRSFLGFTEEAKEALKHYRWPGNLRELRNAIERSTILAQGNTITVDHLPESIVQSKPLGLLDGRMTLQEVEEQHIRRVLATTKTLQEAADTLGIDQATLWRKRKLYGI
jgi:NtrC-family two-component system response regulator AlgB